LTKPIDETDPVTECKGILSFEEIPQLTNPLTGWMQNCNTTPFLLTSEGNPDHARFPSYMVQEGDNSRGRISRRILSTTSSFTFAEWTRTAFDTRVITAEELLPQWLSELKKHLNRKDATGLPGRASRSLLPTNVRQYQHVTGLPGGVSLLLLATNIVLSKDVNASFFPHPGVLVSPPPDLSRLSAAYDVLSTWDRRATTDSIAMTIFNAWRERITTRGTATPVTPERRLAALNEVLDALEQLHGTWRVAWGEINRLQRRDESKDEQFSDGRPSLPIPGVNGGDGAVYTFYARSVAGQKRRYGVGGATYVSVVEFASKVRGLSIHVFGASGHPESSHYADQAKLYARGEFKPAWLTQKDIRANLESSYHPGER
jgi:acyl-homoserine-lactone acylase